MSDPLVEAIDALRYNVDDRLHNIVGRMIMHNQSFTISALNEIRENVYTNILEKFKTGKPTPDIAMMLSKIVNARRADYLRKQYTKAGKAEAARISLDDLDEETRSTFDIFEIVAEREALSDATEALAELRDSNDEKERQAYLILEAEFNGILKERIDAIMGKQIKDGNRRMLLSRAKRCLRERFELRADRMGES